MPAVGTEDQTTVLAVCSDQAGLEEAVKRNPEMSFTPEDYARAQKMLDRALRSHRARVSGSNRRARSSIF